MNDLLLLTWMVIMPVNACHKSNALSAAEQAAYVQSGLEQVVNRNISMIQHKARVVVKNKTSDQQRKLLTRTAIIMKMVRDRQVSWSWSF